MASTSSSLVICMRCSLSRVLCQWWPTCHVSIETRWQRPPVDVTFEFHDDVIKWKHVARYWPFVRGIHRSPVKSPHKGQWRGSLMFSLICTELNCWVNWWWVGDLRRYRAHYDVTVMRKTCLNLGNQISFPICSMSCLFRYISNLKKVIN